MNRRATFATGKIPARRASTVHPYLSEDPIGYANRRAAETGRAYYVVIDGEGTPTHAFLAQGSAALAKECAGPDGRVLTVRA